MKNITNYIILFSLLIGLALLYRRFEEKRLKEQDNDTYQAIQKYLLTDASLQFLNKTLAPLKILSLVNLFSLVSLIFSRIFCILRSQFTIHVSPLKIHQYPHISIFSFTIRLIPSHFPALQLFLYGFIQLFSHCTCCHVGKTSLINIMP